MTEQIIGKVMMTFKGDYDTTKQYNFLDTVEYNGSSFVCKANGTHDTPSEHSANWQLLAKAGRDGKDGINGKDGAQGPANVKLAEIDTRSDNNAPSWYLSNYGESIITEFKTTGTIGVRPILTGGFCNLTTIVSWHDATGGLPVQISTSNDNSGRFAYRVATSTSAWGAWQQMGAQGPQGLPGKDGVTPHIDSTTGDWFIGNQDTGTQAQGPAGKNGRDGVDGQPGKDGQNGITPHIDTATGNWFVGSTDTGIKAQGPQGIQGVPGKDGAPGRDGTEVDLSGYATKEAVEQAQTTADNAYKVSSDNTKSISQLSTRVDGIKMPNLSDYAKTSQIPTDVVTHAELTTTEWLDTGTTWLNGNTGSIQYRSITIGNYHIVEVKGSMYITTKAYAITSAFKIPLLGFEDSTTMHFSGGSTITNEIPVAFMSGDPGEVKLYTWQNVNNGWTEVHLSWTYVGG